MKEKKKIGGKIEELTAFASDHNLKEKKRGATKRMDYGEEIREGIMSSTYPRTRAYEERGRGWSRGEGREAREKKQTKREREEEKLHGPTRYKQKGNIIEYRS